jgi:hypothetical protein
MHAGGDALGIAPAQKFQHPQSSSPNRRVPMGLMRRRLGVLEGRRVAGDARVLSETLRLLTRWSNKVVVVGYVIRVIGSDAANGAGESGGSREGLGLRGVPEDAPLLRGATVSDEPFHIHQPVSDSPFSDSDELRPGAENPPFLQGGRLEAEGCADLVGG